MICNVQAYIVVGNPVVECPARCLWPFHLTSGNIMALSPPSGEESADAIVFHFAAALAATVSNPFGTGFYAKHQGKDKAAVVEVATACFGVFGSGAFPGYSGRVRIDPKNGAGFNAHGLNHSKYLSPAVWDLNNSSCWTTVYLGTVTFFRSTVPYSFHASVAGTSTSISVETDPHVLMAATGVKAEVAGRAWNSFWDDDFGMTAPPIIDELDFRLCNFISSLNDYTELNDIGEMLGREEATAVGFWKGTLERKGPRAKHVIPISMLMLRY
ncbi:hypothetical protein RJ640_028401, partial [Escallonia rubra]